MAFTNNMNNLIMKIEHNLGTAPLVLPKELDKDSWVEVIKNITIPYFSRYFPNKIRYNINSSTIYEGFHLIDEDLIQGDVKIIGVRDIAFEALALEGANSYSCTRYGIYDTLNTSFSVEDVAMGQMFANTRSLFDMGLYIDFVEPNKIKITNCTGNPVNYSMQKFPIDLLIEHAPNLMTIPVTQMNMVEKIATCDIATHLWGTLKYYDHIPTTFGEIDLKMTDIEEWKGRKQDIEQELNEGYVSAANKNQPTMMTF